VYLVTCRVRFPMMAADSLFRSRLRGEDDLNARAVGLSSMTNGGNVLFGRRHNRVLKPCGTGVETKLFKIASASFSL